MGFLNGIKRSCPTSAAPTPSPQPRETECYHRPLVASDASSDASSGEAPAPSSDRRFVGSFEVETLAALDQRKLAGSFASSLFRMSLGLAAASPLLGWLPIQLAVVWLPLSCAVAPWMLASFRKAQRPTRATVAFELQGGSLVLAREGVDERVTPEMVAFAFREPKGPAGDHDATGERIVLGLRDGRVLRIATGDPATTSFAWSRLASIRPAELAAVGPIPLETIAGDDGLRSLFALMVLPLPAVLSLLGGFAPAPFNFAISASLLVAVCLATVGFALWRRGHGVDLSYGRDGLCVADHARGQTSVIAYDVIVSIAAREGALRVRTRKGHERVIELGSNATAMAHRDLLEARRIHEAEGARAPELARGDAAVDHWRVDLTERGQTADYRSSHAPDARLLEVVKNPHAPIDERAGALVVLARHGDAKIRVQAEAVVAEYVDPTTRAVLASALQGELDEDALAELEARDEEPAPVRA